MTATHESLIDRVRALVDRARVAYDGQPTAEATLDALRARLDEPLRVAIAGRVKSGKSTLLNALVGEPLAATDAGECTSLVTWYRHGRTYKAFADTDAGNLEPVSIERTDHALRVDLGGRSEESIKRLIVEWPASVLETMTLIDTPGLGSLSARLSARTETFVAPDEDISGADAVVYLARHLHGNDVRLLEAFRDDDAGNPNPVNAVCVLARADEVGGGRLDALDAAARVAARYRSDAQVHRLCQTVVPVAGLLAQGSMALREDEYRVLGRLAEAPDEVAEEILLSADRFGTRPASISITAEERVHLLALLGLFGVRTARDVLRRGEARSAPELAAVLTRRSGLVELRSLLATQFSTRGHLLKARAGLLGLDRILRTAPPDDGGSLAGAVEEVESNAHELTELRLLVALRSGGIELAEAEAAEVEHVVETSAQPARARMELGAEASSADLHRVVAEAVERWRRRAEHPMSGPDLVAACQVMERSYEGMLVEP